MSRFYRMNFDVTVRRFEEPASEEDGWLTKDVTGVIENHWNLLDIRADI